MSESVSITWWGHSTTTMELGGQRILTDPMLTRRVAHLSRIGGAAPTAAALRADAVVVSHLHMDHLHLPSLRLLGADVRVIAPAGAASLLSRTCPELSERLEEVMPGDVVDVEGVRVRVVPAQHDGRRSPVSRHRGPALGYVLETGDAAAPTRVWFAGDTGLFDDMTQIGPVDVAVVPVSGWGPSLGSTHLDPEQAAEAVRRVGAHDAVPVHYGTFWPIGLRHVHPASFNRYFLDQGTRFAARVGPTVRAHVLDHGESVTIAGVAP
jgi:L-ascorbate metabolism protein UlaG (beta-lactamase superfamily)